MKPGPYGALVILGLLVGGLSLLRRDRDAPAAATEDASALPQFLEFGGGTCSECRRMVPVVAEMERRYEGRVRVRSIDIAAPGADDLVARYRVVLIPTQVLADADGTERFRHEGFLSAEDLEREVARLGWTGR